MPVAQTLPKIYDLMVTFENALILHMSPCKVLRSKEEAEGDCAIDRIGASSINLTNELTRKEQQGWKKFKRAI